MKLKTSFFFLAILPVLALLIFVLSGCKPTTAATKETGNNAEEHEHDELVAEGEMLTLPALQPTALNGSPLRVVATTSVIGDVVAQVGGDAISLTVLIGPGVDSHSYQPGAQDLTVVENAHVIFVNGWDLEEALVHDLETIGAGVSIVPVSAGIPPLTVEGSGHEDEGEGGEETDEHAHTGADPHVWFNIHNVEQWVENIEHVLSELDPANAETYANNAETYLEELEELEMYVTSQLEQIPSESRILVTNHDSFSYFADEYGFEILGTVIPAASTLAEPSAADLAGLITEMEEHGVCTIFAETSVSDTLAQTVAGELEGCDEVKVLLLYTEALGSAGGGADSYIGMFRANVDAIVEGLR